jgi:hypothetical protein
MGLPLLALSDAVRRSEPEIPPETGCPVRSIPFQGGPPRWEPAETSSSCSRLARGRTFWDPHSSASGPSCQACEDLRPAGSDGSIRRPRTVGRGLRAPSLDIALHRRAPSCSVRSVPTRGPVRAQPDIDTQRCCIATLPKEGGSCRAIVGPWSFSRDDQGPRDRYRSFSGIQSGVDPSSALPRSTVHLCLEYPEPSRSTVTSATADVCRTAPFATRRQPDALQFGPEGPGCFAKAPLGTTRLQGFERHENPCFHSPGVTPNNWSRSSRGFSPP